MEEWEEKKDANSMGEKQNNKHKEEEQTGRMEKKEN